MMRITPKVFALTWLGLLAALSESVRTTRTDKYTKDDIIVRDVCVVGGGSGGTYAATRLRQLGQSVIVIEKEALMGGNTNTYVVPSSGLTIDYGVVVFHNISVVRDYFAHYNIALAPAVFAASNSTNYVDFRTGNGVDGYVPPDPTAALGAWVDQLIKYPFLATGINLPEPVPADLLLPFRDFVQKYDLGAMVQIISTLGQGYADLIDQPTLYAMKLLGLNLVETLQTGYIATATHDNHAIYDAASTAFSATKSLLLSSYIVSVERNRTLDGTAKIVVQTPSGKKLIKAKKIVVAIPPRTSNFRGWDLDNKEKDVFSTYRNEAYYTGLITNTGLPNSFSVVNIGDDTAFNLPALPGMYGFSPTAQPGLVDVKYASPFEQDDRTVQANVIASLGRLNISNVSTTPKDVKWAAYNAHVPFFEHVTAEQIEGGFYQRASTLQGYRGVWYTGAAWEAHDSSMIWNFTETLIPAIVRG